MRRIITISVLCLLSAPPAFCQNTLIKKPVRPAAKTNVAILVRFQDGGLLRFSVADTVIPVTTKYGKLNIPGSDIRKIELATRIPEKARAEISQAIDRLGHKVFKFREEATRTLKRHKVLAYAELLEAASSSDLEVKQRAEKLLRWLRETVPAEKLKIRTRDVIHTDDSVISCRIETNVLPVQSQQFGKLELKLSDANHIVFVGNGTVTQLKLGGAYALSTKLWMDTGLDFVAGSRVTVEAKGEIDMYASGNYFGQYVGTPTGKKAWPGTTNLPYSPGTLIGKFGTNGGPFVVGANYEGRAGDGRLYLRAAGNPYNVPTRGEYTIQITGGIPSR